MNNFLNVIVFGMLAGVATLAGIYLIIKKEDWAQKNLIYLISFSAGIILSICFTHLLPEAIEQSSLALFIVLASFLAFYVLEHALTLHVCRENRECEAHETFTLVTWAGLLLHSFIDGLIIGVGFEVSYTLGALSALAVLLHRLPDGISSMAVMLHGGYNIKQASRYSLAIAAVTPLGALISYSLFKDADSSLIGLLLAVAAGSFLYVAASDLIPEIHRKSKILNIFLTLLGAIVPLLLEKLIG